MHENFFEFDNYAETFLSITTKSQQRIAFELNTYQRKLWSDIHDDIKNGRPVRYVILKARQLGISTFCAGYLYWRSATEPYTNSMIVAHDLDSTQNIFGMCKRFYDFCPERVRPMRKYSNAKEINFQSPDGRQRSADVGMLSKIEVETAGNSITGRSKTIHHLHISELAFWPSAPITMAGLLQAVPLAKDTSIIAESTANGMAGKGQYFYDLCQNTMQGRTDYKFFFIPWFENPEYQMNPWFTYAECYAEERALMKAFGIQIQQIAWRRYKIVNEFANDEDLFRQEYPATPEEAFIVSGRPVISPTLIQAKMQSRIDKPYEDEGHFRIWYRPPKDYQAAYVIGADVAEGLENGDYSAAFVLEVNTGRQMARIYCKLPPDEFAIKLKELALIYNNALIAPEANNHGHAVISKLKSIGWTNIYRHVNTSKAYDVLTDKIGWQTTPKTKMLMLDEFVAWFSAGEIVVADVDLYRQMSTLIYNERGDVDLGGKDLVVSACIALQAAKQAVGPSKRAYVPDDDHIRKRGETFFERIRKASKENSDPYFT